MLKPDYFTGKEDRLLELYHELEEFIMKDISGRLLTAGKMTATADRLLAKLRMMGESQQAIQKKLIELTGLTRNELRSLLQDAVLTSWEDDSATFEMLGKEITSPLENTSVIGVMDAEYKKSLGELENLTRTTMAQSQMDLMNMLDAADLRVASGVQSYSAAICDILDQYAGRGMIIEYPTGAKRSLEAAVRMCVVTSMNQTTAQVTNQYIAQAQSEYVLVSAHLGARVQGKGQPYLAGHDNWQGRVFQIRGSEEGIPNLLESTGYDIDPVTGEGKVVNPLGLHGYNCRHSHQPWDKRLRNPWRDKDGNLILGDGSKVDEERNRKQYELQQKQRAYERAIRKTKKELLVKRQELELIAETDVKRILQGDYDKLADRLSQQNKAYNEFCAANNLQPQYERNKVSGFNRAQASSANEAATRYSDTQSELHRDNGNQNIGKTLASHPSSDIIETPRAKEVADVQEIKLLGKIDTSRLEKEFEKIQTDEIIVTKERLIHIQQRHPQDYNLFVKYGQDCVQNPEYIIKDEKNMGTVFMVKRLADTNLNVVVRVALETDKEGLKNSVMTFYRLRESNLRKLIEKNKLLYKKE